MVNLTLTLHTKPIARIRPRFARRGAFVSTYNPQDKLDEQFIKLIKEKLGKNWQPIDEPIKLKIIYYLERPKSHFRTGKNKHLLKKSAPYFPAIKPDLDNYIKHTLDCLNKQLFRDDSVIIELHATKLYTTSNIPMIYIHCESYKEAHAVLF